MKSVSIIMVSYRTGPALWLGIDAALAAPECKELILLDNGNPPGDVARMREIAAREKRVTLMSGHGNVGFAKGCNLGAAKATGDYLLLLNPDAVLEEGALAKSLEVLARYPDETLAGGCLTNIDGSEQRGSRRALLTPKNGIAEALGLHRFFKSAPRLNVHGAAASGVEEAEVISGAFMMLARSFYTTLGGMDEGYFLHMEDADFCYRVHKAGGKVLWMPEVKVLHFRSTSEVSSNFIEKQKAKGFVRYLRTHFKDAYSPFLQTIMAAGIWARCGLKMALNTFDRLTTPPMEGRRDVARHVLIHRLARFTPHDNSLAEKTVIVTGASGQIGLCVVGKALARGAKVIGLYNKTRTHFAHPGLTWMNRDLAGGNADYSGVQADMLVHTAALWLLPKALPKLLDSGIKRVVAFSSTSLLGKSSSTNAHEQEIVKLLETGEKETLRICGERNVAVTILRPTMVYGVGLDGNISRLADVARRFGFLPIFPPASGKRMPVQAQDLAEAALGVKDNEKTYGKTYITGGGETLTYREMIERVFAYLGRPPRLIALPFFAPLLDFIGRVYPFTNLNGEMARRMNRDLAFDFSDAVGDFNYSPSAFLAGDMVI